MRVAVIGAAGKVGQRTVMACQHAGLQTVAVARDPYRIQDLPPSPEVRRIAADVLDAPSLRNALTDVQAVICTFGAPLNLSTITTVPTLCTQGTSNLIQIMHDLRICRLICMTAIGVGSSRHRGRWAFRNLIRPILLGRIFQDRQQQEQLVRNSGLQWTIVRPAELTDDPAGPWRTTLADQTSPPEPATIPRATVANFLVHELQSSQFLHQDPIVFA